MNRVPRNVPSTHQENAPVREARAPIVKLVPNPEPGLFPLPTSVFRVTVDAQLVEADKPGYRTAGVDSVEPRSLRNHMRVQVVVSTIQHSDRLESVDNTQP
jgi:hypothetical protein